MPFFAPDFVPSAEARRAHSRGLELPHCDELRLCAAAMALAQVVRMNRLADTALLGPVELAGFALTGFLLASFLLKEPGQADRKALVGRAPDVVSFLRSLPLFPVMGIVAALVSLPRILALESVPVPHLQEIPALFDRWLKSGLADFLRGGSPVGPTLIAWPLALLILPRRILGATFLGFLGCGLGVEFSGVLSQEGRPSPILVDPSPLDLMAAGALASAIWQGVGRRGNATIASWSLIMALALAAASLGSWFPGEMVKSTLILAPTGFGAVNFILKIMATTLVGSLAWRDLRH